MRPATATLLCTLALCLLSAEGGLIAPPNSKPPISTRQTGFVGLFEFVGCDSYKKTQINQAFNDARITLAVGAEQIDWNSAAALEYWGPPEYTEPYRDRITQNYVRAVADEGWWGDWWYDRYIEVHCDDLSDNCNFTRPDGTEARAAAYMYNSGGFGGNTYPIFNFCPGFFDVLRPHAEVVQDMKSGSLDRFSALEMRSQASTFLHEMTHVSKQSGENRFIGDPAVVDNRIYLPNGRRVDAYKPALAKYLAKTGPLGADLASRNSDNYAFYALARFLQKEFGDYPHKPVAYDPGSGTLEDDALDGSNDANVSPDIYTLGPTNPDSLYPADYISKYGGEASPNPTLMPLPADEAASCSGSGLNPNFPPSFVLTDGDASSRDIMYRMRDQACQGQCQNIQGVPGNLMAARKEGDDGCEYAAKISPGKELYMYVTNSGQNCYDATALIIEQCWTTNRRDAGWVNGPNFGEFFQAGVRDLNGEGNRHDPITDDTTQFLSYRNVACRWTSELLWEVFKVEISHWDDGNYGRSIRDNAKGCGAVTEWKYEDEHDYAFPDGQRAEKWAQFRIGRQWNDCVQHAIESAVGLQRDTLSCASDFEELNQF
ncbi:MAG: hypothetical protein M1840_003623 [Geoglossum simile]|nr:MAG: hypothetical protein M1840_003623 [Geoglossum simile]